LFSNLEKQEKERKRLKAELQIKKRLGKNAIVKGMDLQGGATTLLRNKQIGGHRA
jgi:DNA polymerase V